MSAQNAPTEIISSQPIIIELHKGAFYIRLEVKARLEGRYLLKSIIISLDKEHFAGLFDFKGCVYFLNQMEELGEMELIDYDSVLEEAFFQSTGKPFYQLKISSAKIELKKFTQDKKGRLKQLAFSFPQNQLKRIINLLGKALIFGKPEVEIIPIKEPKRKSA